MLEVFVNCVASSSGLLLMWPTKLHVSAREHFVFMFPLTNIVNACFIAHFEHCVPIYSFRMWTF